MINKLYLLRKIKALFVKFKLHKIFSSFEGTLLNLVYLSKISRWAEQNKDMQFNDFYSKNWDYSKRYKLYNFIFKSENLHEAITYLEFGVAGGLSFKWWVENNKNNDSRFYGFDTFEGLPEDWGDFKAGDMSTNSQFPVLNDNRAEFIKGLFQKSLPQFLKEHKTNNRKVIHMDADLYSSTLYCLTSLAPYLNKDDIILFDEFTVPQHEFLAFKNFTESYYLKFQLIAAANNYFFSAFKLIE